MIGTGRALWSVIYNTAIGGIMEAIIGVIIGAAITGISNYFTNKMSINRDEKLLLFERRMEISQKAYALIHELWTKYYLEKNLPIWEKAQKWYVNNCFYLDPKSDLSFQKYLNKILPLPQLQSESRIVEQNEICYNLLQETGRNLHNGIKVLWSDEKIKHLKKSNNDKSENTKND